MSNNYRHKRNSKRLNPKMKRCTSCARMKSIEKYYKDAAQIDGKTTKCMECISAARKKYYEDVEKKRRRPIPNEDMEIVKSSRKF